MTWSCSSASYLWGNENGYGRLLLESVWLGIGLWNGCGIVLGEG